MDYGLWFMVIQHVHKHFAMLINMFMNMTKKFINIDKMLVNYKP